MKDAEDIADRSGYRRDLVVSDLLERAAKHIRKTRILGHQSQEVAKEIGVSRPALYHYIHSKKGLLSQLVDGLTQSTAEALKKIGDAKKLTPDEKLRAAITDMVLRMSANPARFRLLDRSEEDLPEGASREHLAAKRRVLESLESILVEGISKGVFRPFDETLVAFAVLGMCNWVAWWYQSGHHRRGPDPQIVASQFCELILDGLMPDGRADPSTIGGVN